LILIELVLILFADKDWYSYAYVLSNLKDLKVFLFDSINIFNI